MDLPRGLAEQLSGYAWAPVSLGESGARVWRCTMEGSPARYLKAASLRADLRLDQEAERLRWMKERDLPVPTVCTYAQSEYTEYLLLDEVPGTPASDPRWASVLPEVVVALGDVLALLHRTSTVDCPFDQRIGPQVEDIRHRIAAGRVNEDDFDEIRAGRRATDLFAELLSTVPDREDLVFAHGDFSLPNILLRRTEPGAVQVVGLIDCGRAGIADRYQDIALGIRSIIRNFGGEWVVPFLQACGLPQPDPEKVTFFTLLDEFF